MDGDRKDLLMLLGIVMAIFVIKYLFLASKKLQLNGVSNKEKWHIIRDPKTGALLEIEVYRDVKET